MKKLSLKRKEELIAFLNRLAAEQNLSVNKQEFVNIDELTGPYTSDGKGKGLKTLRGY